MSDVRLGYSVSCQGNRVTLFLKRGLNVVGQLLILLVVLLALCVGLTLVYVVTFNGLQTAQTQVVETWSGIEVQLKRRHQLVPGLVSAVKSAMRHETALFEKLIEVRNHAEVAMRSGDAAEISKQEGALSHHLRGVLLQVEDNLAITATGNIEAFQKQLEETEDQIAAARRIYNGNVQNLNARIASFPGNMIAPRHGIRPANSFVIGESEVEAVYAGPEVALH